MAKLRIDGGGPPSERLPNGEIRVRGFDHDLQAYVVKDWPQHPFQLREDIFEDPTSTCKLCSGYEQHHDDLGHG